MVERRRKLQSWQRPTSAASLDTHSRNTPRAWISVRASIIQKLCSGAWTSRVGVMGVHIVRLVQVRTTSIPEHIRNFEQGYGLRHTSQVTSTVVLI